MEKGEQAKNNFTDGYNCAQAVACAFADRTGISPEQSAKLVSGFGGGMGRLREVCGAFSGMVFVLSAIEGDSGPGDPAKKAALYRAIQALAGEFVRENGSIVCRELLELRVKSDSPEPAERNEQYYRVRPCKEIVASAARILDSYLTEKNPG